MFTKKKIQWVIFTTLTLFVIVTSCQQFEMESNPFTSSEYIEIQGNLDDVRVLMNAENSNKYKIAVNRLLSMASQNGSSISFFAQNGADINISEQLYIRITQKVIKQIESGKFYLTKENGQNVIMPLKDVGKGIVRLKSSPIEGNQNTGIPIGDGCNEAQAVINGFKNYDSDTDGNINDIWDMDSRNWGTASQNVINSSFTIGGYSGNVYMNNGCYNSNNNYNGSNDCSGNNICDAYSYWDDQANVGFFVFNDCQGLPLAVIQMSGQEAFTYMGNCLGGSW